MRVKTEAVGSAHPRAERWLERADEAIYLVAAALFLCAAAAMAG